MSGGLTRPGMNCREKNKKKRESCLIRVGDFRLEGGEYIGNSVNSGDFVFGESEIESVLKPLEEIERSLEGQVEVQGETGIRD